MRHFFVKTKGSLWKSIFLPLVLINCIHCLFCYLLLFSKIACAVTFWPWAKPRIFQKPRNAPGVRPRSRGWWTSSYGLTSPTPLPTSMTSSPQRQLGRPHPAAAGRSGGATEGGHHKLLLDCFQSVFLVSWHIMMAFGLKKSNMYFFV